MRKVSALGSLLAAVLAMALGGCAGLGGEGMPPNMPIAGGKFAGIRQGMPYAEFQKAFGDGWMSHDSQLAGTGGAAKYWFFDDGRTIVVPAEVWQTGAPLKYKVVGLMPIVEKPAIPILKVKDDITVTTQK